MAVSSLRQIPPWGYRSRPPVRNCATRPGRRLICGSQKAPARAGALIPAKLAFRLLVVAAIIQRGAEDVAERRARIGRAVLRDGFLLFGDFERLDRHLDLAGLLVELDHAGIDLLTDGEAFGALVVAVTRELGALDEGGEVGTGDLHLDAAFLHFEHFAGHDSALLDIARLGEGVAFELLDAERDALLLDVHIENHGPDDVALLVVVDH